MTLLHPYRPCPYCGAPVAVMRATAFVSEHGEYPDTRSCGCRGPRGRAASWRAWRLYLAWTRVERRRALALDARGARSDMRAAGLGDLMRVEGEWDDLWAFAPAG